MQWQGDQLIKEPPRGVVVGVLRDPAHPPGQPQDRLAIDQGRRLLHDLQRLPRRDKARQSSRAFVPGEDVGHRSVDDTRVTQTHLYSRPDNPSAAPRCRLLHTMGAPSGGSHTMDTLQVDEPHEGVTRITLDRPERLNAMNAVLIAELHEALAGIAVDRGCR